MHSGSILILGNNRQCNTEPGNYDAVKKMNITFTVPTKARAYEGEAPITTSLTFQLRTKGLLRSPQCSDR